MVYFDNAQKKSQNPTASNLKNQGVSRFLHLHFLCKVLLSQQFLLVIRG